MISHCPHCDLRFPVPPEVVEQGRRCPHCWQETVLAVVSADSQKLPASLRHAPARPLVAILDNLRSVYNVGSCFRSADGAGLSHLYLCGVTATPAHPKVAKTSLGAEQTVGWSYHPNALKVAEQLLGQGVALWALEGGESAENLLTITRPHTPLAMIVGNEVAGVDPALLALCHHRVAIPMRGAKESLNVATAFGVAAYWLT